MLLTHCRAAEIVLALALFCPIHSTRSQSTTAGTVTVGVTGHGLTRWEARSDAARQALQQTVKQMVIADRVISGDDVLRDMVLSTVNGFVEAFEVLGETSGADGVAMRAMVTVSQASITNFIAYRRPEGTGVSVDANSMMARVHATESERSSRARMILRLLDGYPESAMTAKVTSVVQGTASPASIAVTVVTEVDSLFIRQLREGALALGFPSSDCDSWRSRGPRNCSPCNGKMRCIDFASGDNLRAIHDLRAAGRLDLPDLPYEARAPRGSLQEIGLVLYSERSLTVVSLGGSYSTQENWTVAGHDGTNLCPVLVDQNNLEFCITVGARTQSYEIPTDLVDGASSVRAAVYLGPQQGRLDAATLERVTGLKWVYIRQGRRGVWRRDL